MKQLREYIRKEIKTLAEAIIKMPLTESDKKNLEENHCNIKEGHCETHESKCTMKEDQCDESLRIQEEREIEEISAGGVPGVSTPLGTDAKGKIPSNKQRKEIFELVTTKLFFSNFEKKITFLLFSGNFLNILISVKSCNIVEVSNKKLSL